MWYDMVWWYGAMWNVWRSLFCLILSLLSSIVFPRSWLSVAAFNDRFRLISVAFKLRNPKARLILVCEFFRSLSSFIFYRIKKLTNINECLKSYTPTLRVAIILIRFIVVMKVVSNSSPSIPYSMPPYCSFNCLKSPYWITCFFLQGLLLPFTLAIKCYYSYNLKKALF